MKRLLPALLAILFFALPFLVTAEVPQQLNYQGRVSVQGVNFNGTGQFKFALVDAPVNQNQTATASAFATLSVTSISVESGGSGYTAPPAVVIAPPDQPGGVQATAAATITGGVVTAINIIEAGSGYSNHPQVTIAPPPVNLQSTIYWSNAGDLAPGQVPGVSVAVPVTNGLYSVVLGDTSMPNMAPFYSNVLSTRLFLRVWFDDGVHGFQQITPDRPLGSAPYALHARLAETVPPGSISGFQLADGSVSSTKMGLGAALANLQASGQSGVPSGAMVLSANANDPNLGNAGYVRVGATRTGDVWTTQAGFGSTTVARIQATAIWTGSEMIVWGGRRDSDLVAFGDGARYDPVSDTWTPIPASLPNSPSPRLNHTAVWTGSEMIVWGGVNTQLGGGYLSDGGRYNPTTNSWTAIPANLPNTPARSEWHSAVWTGSEMIVFGASSQDPQPLTFGRYSPTAHQWAAVNFSAPNIPAPRIFPRMVWTGSEMILWGGGNYNLGDGGRYQPATDSWVSLPASMPGAPSGRLYHTAVWTGTEMIVWGGQSFTSDAVGDGARFNPTTGMWTPLPASLPQTPGARYVHSAIWTGNEMIVWGGTTGSQILSTGGSYDPVKNRWVAISDVTTPRGDHDAVWTGSEMLAWGGGSNPSATNLGAVLRYLPTRELFLYQRP